MPTHRRGRSLSEALTLEQSEEGALVISSLSSASHNQGLKEGDEILGATIHFDQLSKEEVLKVLKLMEPFDDKIHVLTRNSLSKSLGDLDQCARSPETMLKDSYSKLYNGKIKKFMRDDLSGADEGCVDGEITGKPTVSASSKVNLKQEMGLPRLGVDFGLLKPKTLGTDANADSHSDAEELTDGSNLNFPPRGLGLNGITLSDAQVPRLKLEATGPQLNAPDFHLSDDDPNSKRPKNPDLNLDDPSSFEGASKFGLSVKLPEKSGFNRSQVGVNTTDIDMPLDTDIKEPLKKPKTDLKSAGLDVDAPSGTVSLPKFGLSGKGKTDVKTPDLSLKTPKSISGISASDMSIPKADQKGMHLASDTQSVDIKGQSGKYKAPKFTMPKFDLPDIQVPVLNGDLEDECELKTPDLDFSKPKFKGTIGAADLNMPDIGLQKPKQDLSGPDVNFDMPSGKFKVPGMKKPNVNLKVPDMHIDESSSKFKMPKFSFSSTLTKEPNLDMNTNINSPHLSLKTSKIKGGIDAPNLDSPNMDFKAPKLDVNKSKLKMPEFSLPGLRGPETDTSLDDPDMKMNASNVNVKVPKADIEIPDIDIAGPSWKFKKPYLNTPNLDNSGPKLDVANFDIRSPDLDISSPNLSSGINTPGMNMPRLGIKGPKMDLNTPDVNLDMPSGKLKMPELHTPDWDLNAPSSKLKMPKFNLSGTLPKRPDVDLNADLKSTDFSLKAPKMKGGMNAPDLDFPNMKLKDPKLNVSTPDLNIGSPKTKLKFPKLKMPKFGLPNLKGPEIDANFDGPGIDVNAPDVNFKGTKADLDISGQSGKFKKPNLNLPDLGLSGPKLHGPNLDLMPPDFDISGSNLSGAINAPDMNMPKVDFKTPKLDLNTPDLNLDMPSGKLKMPELHAPDWDLNAPSSKLKMPKFNLSGTLPKRPDVDLNADLKSTDFSLKAPKMKGGMNAPDLDFPNMKLKNPKLNVSTPDLNTGLPKAKFKMPKFKMPKISLPSLKGPDIDANFDGPKADLDLDISGQSGKFKKPNFNLPDLGLSGSKIDGPKLDLTPPDLDISSPNLGAGINVPHINMPKTDLKSPKLGLKTPNLNSDMPSGKLKMPTLARPKTELHGPDWDVSAPSSKFKWPKLNFSSTLPKGSNMDISGGLKSPDLSLSAPKVKSGMDVPDLDLPNMDLKAPKLDVNTPDVSIGSPKVKLKMPKINLPNKKGPVLNGNFDGPDTDISVPNSNLKSSKTGFEVPDIDFGSSSGKFKMPNLKMANVGFSGTKLHGPDLDFNSPHPNVKLPKESYLKLNSDLKGPDMNPSLPKMKGRFDSPSVGLPNMDYKDSKTGFEVPDVDFGSPRRTFKVPHLKMPDVGFSGPELDSPDLDLNLPNPNIKLPKGSNLKLNSDLKAPDLNLRASKIKGGFDSSKLGLTNVDLKAPKLDIDTPDATIGFPDANFKKPIVKMPKGFNADIKGDLQGPNLNATNLHVNGPKGLGPRLKGPGVSMSALDLPDARIKGPKLDIRAKHLDVGINGDIGQPDMNFPGPQVKRNFGGPDVNMNSPSVDIHGPQTDLNLPDRKYKFSSFKLPQFGSPDVNSLGSDIDFGASLRPTNLDTSPPNTNLNVKSGELKGHLTSLNLGIPNTDVKMPKAATCSPNLHLKSPDLDIDNPSLKLKKPSYKNRRSDMTSMRMKAPDLDIDQDARLHHTNRMSPRTKVRSSYPAGIDALHQHVDFSRSDLNIDDFTGKDYVLRARGSALDLKSPHNYGQVMHPSWVDSDTRDPKNISGMPTGDKVRSAHVPSLSRDSKTKVPGYSDGYHVTVFPTQTQNPQIPNRKFNTLGGFDFHPGNMDLEVPGENDRKGSTFFFSNLV